MALICLLRLNKIIGKINGTGSTAYEIQLTRLTYYEKRQKGIY